MEFGPRALGGRSIIGDARSPKCSGHEPEDQVSRVVPPFAPAVLRERVADYFGLDRDSPYMLLVADVVKSRRLEAWNEGPVGHRAERAAIGHPAVTHVDTPRAFRPSVAARPLYYDIIEAFDRLTDVP